MKGSSQFQFKQFSVEQARSTHKVGTDGVLLGAWVRVDPARRILDIGAGTGVVSLMLAQRTAGHVTIDAVEIEKEDVGQATKNVAASPWKDRITVCHGAIQDFQSAAKYDLIVTNPPFFQNSLLPPDSKRSAARHSHQLPHEELLAVSARLLSADGRVALILPYHEGLRFRSLAAAVSLHCVRHCEFRSRRNKAIKRLLMEFSRHESETAMEELVLYSHDDKWSPDYRRLTGEFYLNA